MPLLVLPVLLMLPVFASDDDACDMKTVQKMRYCEDEDRILEKDEVVSNQKHWVCESCGIRRAEPGACPDCEEALVEKVSGKDVCKHCYGPTVEVEVCVKKCWRCAECETFHEKRGKCPECEKELVEHTSHSLIVYECPECSMWSYKPGKCTTGDCDAKGKALVRRCTLSGEFPHGGSAD
jgi:hypothetical protein